MPAFRSLYTLTVLAACLAQAMAGGDYSGGSSGSSWGGSSGDSSKSYGSGGTEKGNSGGSGGSYGGGGSNNQWTSTTTTTTAAAVVQAETCPPAGTMTETTTVTAVSACASSVVTAVVTQWMNAPSGCICGAATYAAAVAEVTAAGAIGVPLGNAPIMTTTLGALIPGLSSIPVADAVVTGVTVAATAAAPANTTVAAVGSFPGVSSSAVL
ncbi:hypothetical protein LTR13_004497 [Exophiala sideris]|uniref:Uncharacterized protein n=1 Tax=Exophiala sideris TaxID=1016849 RepID=A0ABR0J8E6_9EURO|nr:hypothetical protein LTR13_004497 [Exophiala sideris]KAK5059005.1 hypothetical protein LTR69_006292 [Exophiala sideris]KAK5182837.1 hypothetical protein LTR44_004545 [Eurotiomycetes sp. CCFEE 6388]